MEGRQVSFLSGHELQVVGNYLLIIVGVNSLEKSSNSTIRRVEKYTISSEKYCAQVCKAHCFIPEPDKVV